jgi:hypothetical protein
MMSFLKITKDYAIEPQGRAFALLGTVHHRRLQEKSDTISEKQVGKEAGVTGMFDLLEADPMNPNAFIITDYKTWGSYKVMMVLGLEKIGKGKEAQFTFSKPFPSDFETDMQLNYYRMQLEHLGVKISGMQVQATVRDGGLAVASSRGIDRNVYLIPIQRLPDEQISDYFQNKAGDLRKALAQGSWSWVCNEQESWNGRRCQDYCEVLEFCPKNGTLGK